MQKDRFSVRVRAKTHQGRRKKNEDFLLVDQFKVDKTEVTLAALADGMGGHFSGEIASKIAGEKFISDLKKVLKVKPSESSIRIKIMRTYMSINKDILDAEKKSPDHKDMGTTLTTLMLIGQRYLLTSLGDTRAYRIREEEIQQVTKDHSAGAEALREGFITEIEAKKSHYANSLLKYLGTQDAFAPDIFPEVGFIIAEPGEVILLCTDGISGVLDELEIYDQVVQTPSLELAVENLITLAFDRGSKDNMSVILVEIGGLKRKQPYLPLYSSPRVAESTPRKGERAGKKSWKNYYVALLAVLIILEGGLVFRLLDEMRGEKTETTLSTQVKEKIRLEQPIETKPIETTSPAQKYFQNQTVPEAESFIFFAIPSGLAKILIDGKEIPEQEWANPMKIFSGKHTLTIILVKNPNRPDEISFGVGPNRKYEIKIDPATGKPDIREIGQNQSEKDKSVPK